MGASQSLKSPLGTCLQLSTDLPLVLTSAKFFFLYLYNSVTQVLTVASGGCHHRWFKAEDIARGGVHAAL